MDYPLLPDETARLQALDRYAILDTPAEEIFDRVTRMAARLFSVPMALISLVDRDRQWFKSCYGIEACQTDRDIAFCTHAIVTPNVMVVTDAHSDSRFTDNPLVTGPPYVRFYAGAPLLTSDGFSLGTLCVLSPEPRPWSREDSQLLTDLAAIVMDEFELRSAALRFRREAETAVPAESPALKARPQIEALIAEGNDLITVLDPDGTIRYQSPSAARLLGYNADSLLDTNLFDYVHHDDHQRLHAALKQFGEDRSKRVEVQFRWKHEDGSWHEMESMLADRRQDPATKGIVLTSRDVTENRHTQEELRQAQLTIDARVDERTAELIASNAAMQEATDQLQAVLDAVPGSVAWISSSLRYLGVNEYLANFLQLPAEEIEGRSVSSFKHTPEFTRFARDVFVSPARTSAQEITITLKGRPCVFLMIAQKYRNGQAAVFVGVDITKRKQVENALQKAEEKYRNIFENAVEGIFQATPDGRYRNVNPALAAIYGYDSPEEFINSPANQNQTFYVDPGRRDEFLRLLEERGHVSNFDSQVYRRDGSIIWISESARPVRDEFNALQYYEGFVDDITARKYAEEGLLTSHEELERRVQERTLELTEANDSLRNEMAERLRIEAELRQSEARKAAILEAALDCIISIDHEGRVIEWNPACEPNLGYSREEAVGQLLGDLIVPPALRDAECFNLQHEFNAGGGLRLQQRMEVPAMRADGSELTAEISIVRTPISGPPQYTVYLQDITARKRADEAVRQAKAEAEAANRAKSEFLSRMSHELRTPLNGILGFAQVLQMDFTSGMHRDIVDDIFKAGKHLLSLINEVLDISRIESGHLSLSLEPIPLYDLVQENLDLVSALAWEKNIAIDNQLDPNDDEHVLADRQRLAQCLLNLLSNGIKYNRDKGSITVRSCTGESGKVRLEVSDNGLGIPPDKLGSIFTPFERLGAEQTDIEGTGLGLALTKRLMESMGGGIGVESVRDEGSTFWLEMASTVAPIESVTGQEAPVDDAPIPTRQNVVLYIEDNLANFKVIELVLTHRPNVKLLAAMQGSIGLELAAQNQPDMLLLDLNLPDMHGTEVLRRLRENPETQKIPVVVLSADATPGQITRVLDDGARVYLTKPLDVQLFLKVLDETLAD